MPDLMAQMAQQRAVGLAQAGADLLAHRVVGLVDIERDDAAGMSGHDRLAVDRAQEVEGQAARAVLAASARQT